MHDLGVKVISAVAGDLKIPLTKCNDLLARRTDLDHVHYDEGGERYVEELQRLISYLTPEDAYLFGAVMVESMYDEEGKILATMAREVGQNLSSLEVLSEIRLRAARMCVDAGADAYTDELKRTTAMLPNTENYLFGALVASGIFQISRQFQEKVDPLASFSWAADNLGLNKAGLQEIHDAFNRMTMKNKKAFDKNEGLRELMTKFMIDNNLIGTSELEKHKGLVILMVGALFLLHSAWGGRSAPVIGEGNTA